MSDTKKDFRFWMLFVSLCVVCFLSALDFIAIGNALPSIINDLSSESSQGEEFAWIGTAYTLTSTAFLPLSSCVAESFGRRVAVVVFLVVFCIGSALCGAAQTMDWLIAARAVQGVGGGALHSLATVVIADLIPLAERGTYNSFVGMTWALAVAIGPLIGGALANDSGSWRWLFYLNLPICALALVLVFIFLDLPTPSGSVRQKFSQMDWIGNFIIAASSTALVIGLSWGGGRYEWNSYQVIVPLVLGAVGMLAFGLYEAFMAKYPIFPPSLLSNRTSASGYLQIAINMTSTVMVVYFVPVYYQACMDASPIRSGVMFLGCTTLVGSFIVFGGISVTALKCYRPQIWVSWCLTVIGVGLATTLDENSPLSKAIGYFSIGAMGVGAMFALLYFPVLSPLPVSRNAQALALFAFLRSFAQVWGVTIGSTILTNSLKSRLPEGLAPYASGDIGALVYSLIPKVRALPQPLKDETRAAFAESFRAVWVAIVAIFAVGLFVSIFMSDIPLHNYTDEKWSKRPVLAVTRESTNSVSSDGSQEKPTENVSKNIESSPA